MQPPPPARKTVRLHPVQAEFRNSQSLYRGFVGGRGSGKTWCGAYDLVRRARRGRTYMAASPTAPMMADTTFPTFKAIAEDLGVLGRTRLTPYPTIELTTGANVRFRTAENPEKLRGPNLSGVWLDEASLMPVEAFRIAIASLRERGEQGWLSATFTPKGPTHWTYDEFATNKPNSRVFRCATRLNPFLPAGFADKILTQYGETNFARQELDGDFVQIEGSEFPAEWFGNDLWFNAWPENLHRKVIALDPSKGADGRGDDFQAHVLLGAAVENGRYVFYADADLQREGVVPMTERTVSLYRRFSAEGGPRLVDSVVVEENGTMGLLPPAFDAACARAGVWMPYLCRTNLDNKEFRIRYYCAPPLSRRQVRFRRTPGARLLLGQLQSFPLDEHDDGPDAFAVALRMMAELLAA